MLRTRTVKVATILAIILGFFFVGIALRSDTETGPGSSAIEYQPTDVVLPESPPPADPTPTATTTPDELASKGRILWRGDVETGDLSQWRSVSISGKADVEVITTPVHDGSYALQLINWDVDGTHNAGVRMNLQGPFDADPKNLPDDGYYSAWYFIPFVFEGNSNIFQFKQSDVTERDPNGDPMSHTRRMLWKIGLLWDDTGAYDLEIRTRIDADSGDWQPESVRLGIVDTNIPIGTWFHLESRYVWGMDGTGRTTVWLNDEVVWDEFGTTEASNLACMHRCREWVVGHYLSDYQGYVAPGDSWIFVDDALLSTTRVGTA